MKILYQLILWLLGVDIFAEQPKPSYQKKGGVFLNVNDEFISFEDACSGFLATGATGSGKSSIGLNIIINMLIEGLGGLVLTAKPDEVLNWKIAAKHCNREEDLIIFGADEHRFNWLNYESTSAAAIGGGLTENILNLLLVVLSAERKGQSSGDEYWLQAKKQLIRNCLSLLELSGEPVTIENMLKIVNSAALYPEEAYEEQWQKTSYCYMCLSKIEETEGKVKDKSATAIYWISEFPGIASRTRSIIVSSLTSLIDQMGRGVMAKFLGGDTTFTPEAAFEGKVIIMAFDVLTYKDIGVKIQMLMKMIFQRACERRKVDSSTLPAFLYSDEAQYFYISEGRQDMMFQTTCRSQKIITVCLTQSIQNYFSIAGNGNEAEIQSYIANLRTKAFLANGSIQNNKYSSDSIGHSEQWRLNINTSAKGEGSYGLSQQLFPEIPPYELLTLKMGGPPDFEVEAIILTIGKKWRESGKHYVKTTYKQIMLPS